MSYRQTSPTSMVRWSTVQTRSTPSPESSSDARADADPPAAEDGYAVDASTPQADATSDEEGVPWRSTAGRAALRTARPAPGLVFRGSPGTRGTRRLKRPLARAAQGRAARDAARA